MLCSVISSTAIQGDSFLITEQGGDITDCFRGVSSHYLVRQIHSSNRLKNVALHYTLKRGTAWGVKVTGTE